MLLCTVSKEHVSNHWHGGREHYTSPKIFLITFFIRWTCGLLLNFNWLVHILSVQTFLPLIVICIRGNFVIIEHVHQFIDQCLIPLDP